MLDYSIDHARELRMYVTQTLKRAMLLFGKETAVRNGELTLNYRQFGERIQRFE